MLLTKLSVQNFGLFRDKNEFDLSTKDTDSGKIRPIILFGGKNGAGKTTLFEAFRICLYGRTLPEFAVRGENYDNYLRKKIHKSINSLLPQSSAVISIEFEYARLGHVDKYGIRRRWDISDHGIDEHFEVRMNGKIMEDLEASHWQDFIKELIPIGVSKLFFFDGEQIQSLAEDDTDEVHLKNSFYSLLGLDLVDRLQSDLRINLTRHSRESDQAFGKELNAASSEANKLEEEILALEQKKGSIVNKINNRRKRVIELEERLAGEGHSFAKKRKELEDMKTHLLAQIEQTEKWIKDLCEGLLPFTFAPEYCIALKKRLVEEEESQSEKLASKKLRHTLGRVEKQTLSRIKKIENKKLRKDLKSYIRKIILDAQPHLTRKSGEIKQIHYLSNVEQRKILGWIDMVLQDTPHRIKHLTHDLEKLTNKLQKTQDSLNKVPSDQVTGPLVKQLNSINQEIGSYEQLIRHIDDDKKTKKTKLELAKNRILRLEGDKRKFEKLSRGLMLAQNVQEALKEYEVRLKKEKLDQLGEYLLECLNGLMHKEILRRVAIDPETFEVMLYDVNDNPIPKEQLSAGEKQIYAIAILWALAKTSGRPLPFIVDTPLGRLDSDHRSNLVQNFFPVASHQVIIFSTDTEIDEEYFEALSDHISSSYRLEYDNAEGRTKFEKGYFWRTKREESGEEVAISK